MLSKKKKKKAFTESCELHRHRARSVISYSGEEDGCEMWRMSAGRSETERKDEDGDWEKESGTLPSQPPSSLPQPRLNFVLLVAEDGTGPAGGNRLNIALN